MENTKPKWLYVMSREWLWQSPYTTLELQHLPGATIEPLPGGAGQRVEGEDINLCPDPKWLYVLSREWLWQRPYTTLELQHLPGATIEPLPEGAGQGVEGIEIGRDRLCFSTFPNKTTSFLQRIILRFFIFFIFGPVPVVDDFLSSTVSTK
jgi:hypothetical protein